MVKFLVFGDLHYDHATKGDERIREILTRAKNEKAEFIVSLGDIVAPFPKYAHVIEAFRNAEVPVYHVLGNHDVKVDLAETMSFLGLESPWYSFVKDGVKFIFLNSCYEKRGDEEFSFPETRGEGVKYPLIPQEELAWLETELSDGMKYVIFSHHSLTNEFRNRAVWNRQEVFELFKGKQVLLCMNGHDHGEDFKLLDHVPYYTMNSAFAPWIGFPNGSTPELEQKYGWLHGYVPYDRALSAVVTIEDLQVRIEGMQADYEAVTPTELGLAKPTWNGVSVEPKASSYVISFSEKENMLKLFGPNVFKVDLNQTVCVNSIYQMSDMPDKVLDGEKDCYIGYEEIGEGYSGKKRFMLVPRCVESSKLIAEYVKDGIFLDLACGDGAYTVPCAKLGLKIIGGDISNKMMSLLMERAEKNNVLLDKVVLCRMNALDIPLEDESVDCVIANSMLHLISHPEKVVDEIHRVLKKGGVFLCFNDAPGRNDADEQNNDYMDAIGEIYRKYWECLEECGIKAKKYSWRFDRNGYCETKFRKEERIIPWEYEYVEKVGDSFLTRFASRGFSDQTSVPEKEHAEALQYALESADKRFGEGWREFSMAFRERDILVTVFTK